MIGDSSFLGLGDAPGGGIFSMLANGLVDPALLLKYIQMLQGNKEGGTVLDAAHQRVLGQFLGDHQDGSLFGGGKAGVTARDVEMMGRGRAPATASGIATAVMNAVGALKGAVSPTGLIGLGMTATGTRPSGFLGGLFGGDIRDIPGYSAYDKDLIAAVGGGGMTRAQADSIQASRNANSGNTSGGGSMRGGYGGSVGGNPGGGQAARAGF